MNMFHSKTMLLIAVLTQTAACTGGTKLIKEPEPQPVIQRALASASDHGMSANLDWVIVRNGPGAWARNADWDEYLIEVANMSDEPVQILSVSVVESLGNPVAPRNTRRELVNASKRTARRYRDADVDVTAGVGTAGLIAAGAAVTAAGISVAYGAAYGSILAGGASVGAGAGALAGGLLLAGPALAIGGIVRGANNGKVDREIQRRRTALPMVVAPGETRVLDVFFPLAPAPIEVTITYADRRGEHRLTLDTRAALSGLHLEEEHS